MRRSLGDVVREVVVRALDPGGDSGDARDDRLLRALVQPLAPTPDRGEELVQVDLERREDRVGPLLDVVRVVNVF
jgi:hypothetical protein